MAKIYTILDDVKAINITASVGKNGVNHKDDVMVVQAMLKYSLEGRSDFKGAVFPYPTGTMCRKTASIIRDYQRFLRKNPVRKVSVDGRIDPAQGRSSFGKKGEWTINHLNNDVQLIWLLDHGGRNDNYMYDLCKTFPQLFPILKDVPVGTLGLPLE